MYQLLSDPKLYLLSSYCLPWRSCCCRWRPWCGFWHNAPHPSSSTSICFKLLVSSAETQSQKWPGDETLVEEKDQLPLPSPSLNWSWLHYWRPASDEDRLARAGPGWPAWRPLWRANTCTTTTAPHPILSLLPTASTHKTRSSKMNVAPWLR